MVGKRLILAVMLLIIPFGVYAESRIFAELSSFGHLLWDEDEQWDFIGSASGELDIRSQPRAPVQARLQLRATAPITVTAMYQQLVISGDDIDTELEIIGALGAGMIEVPRAHLRFRFPVTDAYSFRVTAGIDRVTWGLGSVLKAGDLLFGPDISGEHTGLAAFDEVRSETAMLFAFYFPVGDMSYTETVVRPRSGEVPDMGFRNHSAFGTVSLESAYLYRGEDAEHVFALSSQGEWLGADIYGGVSYTDDFHSWEDLHEGITLTAGAFRTFRVGFDQSLNIRTEGLYSFADDGRLLLYGDIGYIPGRTVQLFARALVEPADDLETAAGTGISWNIFQGMNIRASAMSGFSTSGPKNFAVSAGAVYSF